MANNRYLYNLIRWIFLTIVGIWYYFIPRLFSLRNLFNRRKIVGPVRDEILLNSAIELAKQIRDGEITSEELVQACIKRITEINEIINAVVEDNFEQALAEAKRVDQSIASGTAAPLDRCPLLGVPFTTKDGIPINGLLCTAGILARRNIRVFEDAECVALLKKAGAIPLAVTNGSEVNMWWECSNGIYGRSSCPYDTRRTTGGSSGGESALQAAAGTVLGIGSDVGGSIRIPALFNGVFGHKPTGGIVSTTNMVPSTRGFRARMLTAGPICRYAEDLLPLLRILAGENIDRLHLDSPVDFQRLRIFYMNGINSVWTMKPDLEISDAMHRAMKYFEMRYNTVCYRLDLPLVHWAVPIWFHAIQDDKSPSFSQEMCNRNGDLNAFFELLKWIFGQSDHTIPAIGLAITEKFSPLIDNDERRRLFQHLRRKLHVQLDELLADNGVLFFPSHPTAAPFHNQPLFTPINFAYTALFNALTLPVTQCPMGLNSAGIPVGLQVVAASCNDHLTIAVAQELEKAFGGWTPPGSR